MTRVLKNKKKESNKKNLYPICEYDRVLNNEFNLQNNSNQVEPKETKRNLVFTSENLKRLESIARKAIYHPTII